MGSNLTQNQGVALQAVINCGEGAYGVPIRAEYQRLLDRPISIGAMYTILDRLVDAGYLEDSWSEPTSNRGGRRRRMFKVSGLGETVLSDFMHALARLLPQLEGNK